MRKAQTFATIKSKVNAQKLRRRMWSVRGIGTIHLHFTVAGRGCPREKPTPKVNFGEEAFPAWAGSLAAHAAPREIEFREKLPKTRSGRIMRRVLKAWELGLPAGDLSTLED